MPKVSIVIVNYNYARYLDERITTLLNQSYKDFELIIVDNGSTDNSVDVIKKYADPRIKLHLFPENKPPFQRWNEALDSAEGEYFLITAADDSALPTLLEKIVEKLEFSPTVGLAFSQSWDIDDQGKRLRSWKEWTDDLNEERWSKDFIDDGKNECKYLLFKCTIPNPSAVLMRRSVFFKVGKFDTQLRYLTDWMLWVKILLASDIAFVAEPLNNYRTHTSSLTNATKPALELEERVQIIHHLFQNLQAPSDVWEAVYNQTVGCWSKLIVDGNIPFQKSQKIYKFLSLMDKSLNYRLLRHIVKDYLRKIQTTLKPA